MISIGESFTQISANIEEHTATSQQMSSNLLIIHEKSTKLKSEADRTGQAFFDISQKIDTVRINTLDSSETLDNVTMIELSITDHLMWKWKIYNMLLGHIQLKADAVEDHHGCRLGKWLKTLDRNNQKINEILMKIEGPHLKIHEMAKKAIQAYNSKHFTEAEQILPEIEKYSIETVEWLHKLKQFI